jgi:hypothetical protein
VFQEAAHQRDHPDVLADPLEAPVTAAVTSGVITSGRVYLSISCHQGDDGEASASP